MGNLQTQEEIQEYLAKIRKTVSESQALVQSARLRIDETDRMLASNGLTREDVLAWHPTREQRLLVNETLRAHGLPPIEEDDSDLNFDSATQAIRSEAENHLDFQELPAAPGVEDDGADVMDERQRKFRNFMREYRL